MQQICRKGGKEVMATPILNYPNYTVNEKGKIYSIKSNKFIKPSITKNGYMSVELFNENGSKRMLAHRIVAMAYIPNPNDYPQVNHIDENPSNNNVENLEWCTAKYNMNYGNGARTRHLKIDYSKPCYRENAIKNGKNASVPVLQISLDGNVINRFESIKDAERYLEIKNSHICDCCKGRRKTSNGFLWKYERSDDLSQYQY